MICLVRYPFVKNPPAPGPGISPAGRRLVGKRLRLATIAENEADVCGPQGEWLARAGEEDEILFADVPLERSETVRRIWPFFRDRRVDAYQALSKRFDDG